MTIGLESVGPDLGLNCLQRLSADDKLLLSRKNFNLEGKSFLMQ